MVTVAPGGSVSPDTTGVWAVTEPATRKSALTTTTTEPTVNPRIITPEPVRFERGRAIFLALIYIIFPQLIIREGAAPDHGALVLGALGMAAGFVHGVGFVPRKTVFRIILGPTAAWLLMPLGSWLMLN
ncbi:MAG: cyd operon YbgE family protein [Xanthomonadales bacterium]